MGKGRRLKDKYILLLGIYIIFFFAVALVMALEVKQETVNGSEEEGVNQKREEGNMEKIAVSVPSCHPCCLVEEASRLSNVSAESALFGPQGNELMSSPSWGWNISEIWEFWYLWKERNTLDIVADLDPSLADGYSLMFRGEPEEWGESHNSLHESRSQTSQSRNGNSKVLPKILRWVAHAFRWDNHIFQHTPSIATT